MALAEIPPVLGIELAPARIPLERRLQTIGVIYYVFLFFFSGITSLLSVAYIIWCGGGCLRALLLCYFVWYIWDRQTCARGGRRSEWIRSWRIATWLRDYFPVRLVKTTELDPQQNYIFGCHPHGIACFGIFVNFCTEANGFSKLFPGIVPYALTLKLFFDLPFVRELLFGYGFVSVSKKSIMNILNHKGKGNAAIIVVGGAQEVLDAVSSVTNTTTRLNLNSRFGFVRMAIQNGAHLVPVFSFGENDLYHQAPVPDGSFLRKTQTTFKKYTGLVPPLFHGRGIFQYSFGLLPYRRPVMTVVGAPIPVVRKVDPTESEVRELHSKYIESLKELFETHKKEFGNENLKLEIY